MDIYITDNFIIFCKIKAHLCLLQTKTVRVPTFIPYPFIGEESNFPLSLTISKFFSINSDIIVDIL